MWMRERPRSSSATRCSLCSAEGGCLARLHFTPGSQEVVYVPKAGHDDIEPTEGERIDAMEFVARVLVQIPDPRRHLVRYYGAYSNASRGKRKRAAASAESIGR
jgi:hypothetical protein